MLTVGEERAINNTVSSLKSIDETLGKLLKFMVMKEVNERTRNTTDKAAYSYSTEDFLKLL